MKIALVNYDDLSVWLFRQGLIKQLLAAGHEVHVLCGGDTYVEKLRRLGVTVIPLEIPRFVTPWQDLKGIARLVWILRRNRYDLVHLFQVKILIYGAVAAWLAGVRRRVGSHTGAGIIFNTFQDRRKARLQRVVRFLYARTMPLLDRMLFQNETDRRQFCEIGLATMEKTTVVKSSGVNIAEYSQQAVNQQVLAELRQKCGDLSGRVVVTMVARVVETKGTREFIEAAKSVERAKPGAAVCLLFGDIEHGNPETLSAEYVRSNEGPAFRWLGWTNHVREALALSDVAVLPSYREGTPRSLLEAMAMHRPIVTTDAPGCTNVIEDGRNGFMVPVRDAAALAQAILKLVENPDMREAFGRRSYEKVREEFEENKVAKAIIANLYRIGNADTGGA